MPLELPEEPRQWGRQHVDLFASDAEPSEVARVLLRLLQSPDDQSLNVMVMFLGARHENTFLKPIPSQLALRALLSLGARGVDRVIAELRSKHGDLRYPSTILQVLWHVSRGRGLVDVMSRVGSELCDLPIPSGTDVAIRRALQDLFAEARVNIDAFTTVAAFLHEAAMRLMFKHADDPNARVDPLRSSEETSALMSLFAEGAIKLTRSALDDFSTLIANDLVEERYQVFLQSHPVLLDPLAAEIIPKQRLGSEFATDFAVRSHDNRWLLVEIERPHDDVFTEANDFRSRFTHAFGQVLDFQHWVDDNVAYAQRHMPHITAPRGLLVMGLRSRLTDAQQAKLRRFVDNSRRIEVVTYDDLLARAVSLYENLHYRSA